MNILVLDAPISGSASTQIWREVRRLGHNPMYAAHKDQPVDLIISMSISRLRETLRAIEVFPNVPLYCYNWDCYEWIWKQPRNYDWDTYGKLLQNCREIWVPSICTGLRTTQWWDLKNWKVILSGCPIWDPEEKPKDNGYALCCLRQIPDSWWGEFQAACGQLNIPCQMTTHSLSFPEYKKAVANCRFICSPLWELSTGGLSLLEAYRLGKPVLVSDSKWNGVRDYFGERANYFDSSNKEYLKGALHAMYHQTPPVEPDHKEWVEKNFSMERMARDIVTRLGETL